MAVTITSLHTTMPPTTSTSAPLAECQKPARRTRSWSLSCVAAKKSATCLGYQCAEADGPGDQMACTFQSAVAVASPAPNPSPYLGAQTTCRPVGARHSCCSCRFSLRVLHDAASVCTTSSVRCGVRQHDVASVCCDAACTTLPPSARCCLRPPWSARRRLYDAAFVSMTPLRLLLLVRRDSRRAPAFVGRVLAPRPVWRPAWPRTTSGSRA
jgi:hypothetical protein